MILSRLILDPRSRDVRRDMRDCHELHRTLMSAFPRLESGEGARASLGVLFRSEVVAGRQTLLVQSHAAPDWSLLPEGYLLGIMGNPAVKEIDGALGRLQAGDILAFRLLANPTRKIDTKSGPDGARRNGRRVELRREDDQLAWLRRKAEDGGFQVEEVTASPGVLDVRSKPAPRVVGRRKDPSTPSDRRALTFGGVLFEGRLRVRDAAALRQAVSIGVGPGKAYGLGLLSLASPADGAR